MRDHRRTVDTNPPGTTWKRPGLARARVQDHVLTGGEAPRLLRDGRGVCRFVRPRPGLGVYDPPKDKKLSGAAKNSNVKKCKRSIKCAIPAPA
jgi:hypothetical protein